MPLYDLKCVECDRTIEVRESYDAAMSHKCEICGRIMKMIPSRSLFIIHGYNAANGYHRETINYDGTSG